MHNPTSVLENDHTQTASGILTSKRIIKETGELGNKRMSEDHPNFDIIENG